MTKRRKKEEEAEEEEEEEEKECAAAESLVIKINLALLPLALQGGARDKTNAKDQDIVAYGRYSSVLCWHGNEYERYRVEQN